MAKVREKPGLSRLISEVEVLPERELHVWIEEILTKTNISDLETLNEVLTKSIKIDRLEKLANRDFKICDKCFSTYPKYTNTCIICKNPKLRTFRTPVEFPK